MSVFTKYFAFLILTLTVLIHHCNGQTEERNIGDPLVVQMGCLSDSNYCGIQGRCSDVGVCICAYGYTGSQCASKLSSDDKATQIRGDDSVTAEDLAVIIILWIILYIILATAIILGPYIYLKRRRGDSHPVPPVEHDPIDGLAPAVVRASGEEEEKEDIISASGFINSFERQSSLKAKKGTNGITTELPAINLSRGGRMAFDIEDAQSDRSGKHSRQASYESSHMYSEVSQLADEEIISKEPSRNMMVKQMSSLGAGADGRRWGGPDIETEELKQSEADIREYDNYDPQIAKEGSRQLSMRAEDDSNVIDFGSHHSESTLQIDQDEEGVRGAIRSDLAFKHPKDSPELGNRNEQRKSNGFGSDLRMNSFHGEPNEDTEEANVRAVEMFELRFKNPDGGLNRNKSL
mmetsp:Transcript_14176/g.15636  ORF Transcript_14176/g.15636 Transcript_14176/m.15636 type:complete len:406 (+) Transcript_14176:38-1255(+)